jgi:hypothetical protein
VCNYLGVVISCFDFICGVSYLPLLLLLTLPPLVPIQVLNDGIIVRNLIQRLHRSFECSVVFCVELLGVVTPIAAEYEQLKAAPSIWWCVKLTQEICMSRLVERLFSKAL